MGIRNTNWSGSDFTEEKLTPTDLNDTFDAVVEDFPTTYHTFSWMPDEAHLDVDETGGGSLTDVAEGIKLSAGSNDNVQVSTGNYGPIGYDKDIKVRALAPLTRVSGTGTINDYIYFISDNDTASSATKYAGFRIEHASSVTTVKAVSKDGTTEESTTVTSDYGNTSNSNTLRVLEINFTSGTSVVFKINGDTVATHSTNIPPAADTTTQVIILALENDTSGSGTNELTIGPITVKWPLT